MEPLGYLGIDFGTTNSYFCACDRYLTLTTIKFDQSVSGGTLPTAVLWRAEGEPERTVHFGVYAINEWGEMPADERRRHCFATQFKPDLAVSEAARTAARHFLGAARRHMVETGKLRAIGADEARPVVIGVPAKWGEEERRHVRDIARACGYGEVLCAEEPIGALIFHLREGSVRAVDARRGTLVIDFGGGTLDIALLVRGRVVKAWGDSLLGGRLFDDVFFQWTLDANPGLLERWEEDQTLFYHQMHSCREMKERFSKAMAMREGERLQNFSYLMQPGPGGLNIRGGAQDEFERRCRAYVPSPQLRRMFENFGVNYARLHADGPLDLFDWIRRGIAESPDGPVRASEVDQIIITGGSGNWPFFPALVEELFPGAVMERSADPEAAIAMGLALLRPLQERYHRTTEALKAEVETKAEELWLEVRDTLGGVARSIAEEIGVELYDRKIVPLFHAFRREGGRPSDLQKRVAHEVKAFQPHVESIVRRQVEALQPILNRRVKEFILAWFAEHQVGWEVQRVPDTRLAAAGGLDRLPHMADNLFLADLMALSVVSSVVIGSLCGGGGIALIATGPVGWLVGAILGLLGGFGLGAFLDDVPIPRHLTRMLLWESRLHRLLLEGRLNMRDTIVGRIRGEITRQRPEIQHHLRDEMRAVIDALSFVDTLLPR